MALSILAGRAEAARRGALGFLREALRAPGAGEAIFLVPDQYTLQAEIDALEEMGLPGSFRLQVLSPRRLYQRVFERAGGPREALVDEQGRVMLMHAAAQRLADQMIWYKGALARPGFAEKCVRQVDAFKQAGLTSEDLEQMGQGEEGALGMKLRDLSKLYQAYEEALSGRFMDGEDQARRACERMERAEFLRGARVCVYGFDMILPTLRRVILSLLPVAREVAVALALAGEEARDAPLFAPVRRSLARLTDEAREMGVPVRWTRLEDRARGGALGRLQEELFCAPQTPCPGRPGDLELALGKNPQAEAEYAAALIRRLCRTRGWRYRDFYLALATGDEAFTGALRRAFRLYRVPLFLTEGRPADRHPLCVCLLSALRAVTRGWALADLVAYVRSGFSPLCDDEADLLVNYAQARGLRGRAWRAPLTRGSLEELEIVEPLRQKAVEPLMALARRAGEARDLEELLGAVFTLLEDVRAYDKMEERHQALRAQGLAVWAAEGMQVWNRVVQALEQMAELLSGQKMRLKSVYEMLRRALSAAVVKALPQSSDAVEGGALEHLRAKPIKALLVVGASDAGRESAPGLLADEETGVLREAGVELGVSARERQRMRRLGLKSLLSMTEEFLLVSRAQSDASGRALQSGALMNEVARLMPDVPMRGGLTGDDEMLRVCLEQADGALCRLPGLLPGGRALPRAALKALEGIRGLEAPLQRMRRSFAHKVYSEKLDAGLAQSLLAPAGAVSVSRLERFAACPFRHFAHYALRPQEFRPYALSPRDAGTFYHQALEAFITQNGEALGEMDPEQARRKMDLLTADLVREVLTDRAGDSALAAAEGEKMRRVARRAASIIARQFDGSRFRPCSAEADIAGDEVRVEGETALGGRIDRIDVWDRGQEGKYLRVIDYKTGGRTVRLQDVYYGLQLQLVLYLAAAMAQLGAKPAGVFYFKVDDPLMDTESTDPEEVEREREMRLRLDGLVLKDENVVRAMAASPERALNVAFKRDGALRASDKLLEPDDFSRLIAHALDTAKRMLHEMRDGETGIAPAQASGAMPCRFCEYGAVCGYDARLEGANPRILPQLSAREVLDALREKPCL